MRSSEEILEFTQQLLIQETGRPLNYIQKVILRESLAEISKTYSQIAQENNYSENYIKQGVAFKLWKQLSDILGEKINKTNCRSLLEEKRQKFLVAQNLQSKKELPPINLEFPEGQVPLNSLFYIQRKAELIACQKILIPGTLLRIKAPRKRGKTSLMVRILAYGQKQNYYTARLSLHRAGSSIFASTEKFLRWFCINVTQQLSIESQLDEYWDRDMGALMSCTIYFQEYVLKTISHPLILALDEVNQVFEYPNVTRDFLSLLRSWHEETKDISVWQKLRLLIVYSTDIYLPLETNKSPMNVGITINLPSFNLAEISDLAQRHGLQLNEAQLEQLQKLTGGLPYLVRLTFYHGVNQNIPLEKLCRDAASEGGIFGEHLHEQLWELQKYPKLMNAFKKVCCHAAPLEIASESTIEFDIETKFKLASLGLIKLQGNQAIVSCGLYKNYFSQLFAP